MQLKKLLIVPALLLSACGSSNENVQPNNNEPNNNNNSEILPCGEGEHNFQFIERVEPTAYERGYDLFRCSKCNVEERRNYTGVVEETNYDLSTEYKVLFVGNSHTFYNELWAVFAEICRQHSILVTVDQVTSGGYYLSQFADLNNSYGRILDEKLKTNSYDIVILQEHTFGSAINPAGFFTAVRVLHKKIIATGAQDVLYMPTQRRDGDADAVREGLDQDSLTQKALANHDAIGEELSIPVSHCGVASFDVIKNHNEIPIQISDSHPTPAGTYLMALVHFATIFGVSPLGIEYRFFENDMGSQYVLEQAAHKAAFGPSILRNEYKISSVGIGDMPD